MLQQNPRSKKDEIPADPEKQTGSLVLNRTSYLKHMQPVETSPDWGRHWQRSSKGARAGKLYDWFIQVEIRGKHDRLLSKEVVDLGPATVEQINNAQEFWERYDTAMHNLMRWRKDYDTFGVIGRVASPTSFQLAPSDIKKFVIIRRFRHKQELDYAPSKTRRKLKAGQKVPFSERTRKLKRGKGIKPPSFGDPRLTGGK